jgi:hypothetical protein
MPLIVEMDDLDKKEFMIRCRRNDTNASVEVRKMISEWMKSNPDMPKVRQKPSVD